MVDKYGGKDTPGNMAVNTRLVPNIAEIKQLPKICIFTVHHWPANQNSQQQNQWPSVLYVLLIQSDRLTDNVPFFVFRVFMYRTFKYKQKISWVNNFVQLQRKGVRPVVNLVRA